MIRPATTETSYVFRVGDFAHRAGRPTELPERVEGPGGVSLLLTDAYPPISERSFWAEYQAYRAVLGIPRRRKRARQVAVEVDLVPWSTGRTEVGLRFARPVRPEGNRRDRRYLDAAAGAVDALVRQLEAGAA